MVLTQSTEHVYPYAWDVVTRAFWNKYPNPKLAHVKRVDVIDRYIDKEGCLRTARLAHCSQSNVPSWAESVLGKVAYVYEESICNPRTQTLTLRSKNLSFMNIGAVEETCIYQGSPKQATHYQQESRVTAFIPFISQRLESFSVKSGAVTAAKGLRAMDGICRDIFEGTFTPAFCEAANYKTDLNVNE